MMLRNAAILAFTAASVASFSTSASTAVSTRTVLDAISNRICFESFWWNRGTFRLGKTARMTVRKTGDTAYVWTTELSLVPGVHTWANFFRVFFSGDEAIAYASYGYNVDLLTNVPEVEDNRKQATEGGSETVTLQVPAGCVPKFRADSTLKQRMLATVEHTIAKQLAASNRNGGTNYPQSVQLVIADFNIDYPETQVLIPSTGEVFHVAFRDAADPIGRTFMAQGEYPVAEELNHEEALAVASKILMYGLRRNIRVADH